MPGYVLGNFFIYSVIITTFGTIATLTWVGMGVLIQKVYLNYYRVINIILALTSFFLTNH